MKNIYPTQMHKFHDKVVEYLEDLLNRGQIDVDEYGFPHVVGYDKDNGVYVVKIMRLGKPEAFVINPRKKTDALMKTTWGDDGSSIMRDFEGKEDRPREGILGIPERPRRRFGDSQ